jgi:hypothetical protein
MQNWTRTILLGVTMIAILTLPCTLLGQEAQPAWAGTWKLNLAKSKYSPGPGPKSSTTKVEPWENGLMTTTDTVTAQGEARHVEVKGKFNASDNPVTGNPNVDTQSFRRAGSRSYVVVSKKGGKVTTTTRVSISVDGKTRTSLVSGKNAQGQAIDETIVYDRQ